MDYVGLRWMKCDFHLHTMSSHCYMNQTDTYEQWVEEVANKNLNCIAVTDHNDYRAIDKVRKLAEPKGITVFPGVEITCDTTKIHMLIIFDQDKSVSKVRDFLSQMEIEDEEIGKSDGTVRNVFDVCKKAREKGALVIAAHIDEFNSISSMSNSSLTKLLDGGYIDAAQVSNDVIWETYNQNKNKEEMMEALKKKYGDIVSFEKADSWRKTYEKVKKAGYPLLTFSDNPCQPGESHHGLWGIGNEYTWIKMGDKPSLESVRQALLASDSRVQRCTESRYSPESLPDFWIESVRISSTVINPNKPLEIHFNPQLNTLIGSRGSGKSTVIRILAGALGIANDGLVGATEEEQSNFYRRPDKKSLLGIFTKNSRISIHFFRNQSEYKLTVSKITDRDSQDIHLVKITDGQEEIVEDENFLELLKLQVYTQKQIFELAREPEALLKIIDSEITDIPILKKASEEKYEEIIKVLSDIRVIESTVKTEGMLLTEIEDLNNQIEQYKDSGISDLLQRKQNRSEDERSTRDMIVKINTLVDMMQQLLQNQDIDQSDLNVHDDGLKQQMITTLDTIDTVRTQMNDSFTKVSGNVKLLEDMIHSEQWSKEKEELQKQSNLKREELLEKGLDMKKLDRLLRLQDHKKEQLENVRSRKKDLKVQKVRLKKIEQEYLQSLEIIRNERIAFLEKILADDDHIKININPQKNRVSFIQKLKTLLHKEDESLNEDLEMIADAVIYKKGLSAFRETLHQIRHLEDDKSYSSYFRKTIIDLDDALFDRLISYVPEDEVEVMYKPEGGKKYLPLSAASAGEKTTAILTFVLAYGYIPLLLDQPEDDLDNRLVYELIVKRIKKAKMMRQLIIVTHNANIPVNADSEYIISMHSEGKKVQIQCTGTLDQEDIRKEICDVMEGTEYAFRMRAKKYHLRINE